MDDLIAVLEIQANVSAAKIPTPKIQPQLLLTTSKRNKTNKHNTCYYHY
jgi:hypothetical protein